MKKKKVKGYKIKVFEESFTLGDKISAEEYTERLRSEEQFEDKLAELVENCQKLWLGRKKNRTLTYWRVGNAIFWFESNLPDIRKDYDRQTRLRSNLGKKLRPRTTERYISGFVKFRECFPDETRIDPSIDFSYYWETLKLQSSSDRYAFIDKVKNGEILDRDSLRNVILYFLLKEGM